jgi:hypothetical protein
MKTEEIQKIFETKTLTTDIYLPSSKRSVKVNQMSIEDYKLVCKVNLTTVNQFDLLVSDLVLIEKLTNGEVNINEVDEVDFTILLAHIRENNFLDPMRVAITCSNKECMNVIEHDVDLDKISSWSSDKLEEQITVGDVTIFVGPPKMMDLIYIEKKYEAQEGNIFPYVLDKMISHIKEVYYNDELIEDFNDLNIDKKLELLNTMNVDPTVLIKKISENEILENCDIFYSVKCPKCKNKNDVFIEFNNFFLI